jgi:hypothetical protein
MMTDAPDACTFMVLFIKLQVPLFTMTAAPSVSSVCIEPQPSEKSYSGPALAYLQAVFRIKL